MAHTEPTRRELIAREAELEAKIAARSSTSERQAALITAHNDEGRGEPNGTSASDRQAAYATRDGGDDRGRDVSTASGTSRRQAQAIVDRHRAPRNPNGWQSEEDR